MEATEFLKEYKRMCSISDRCRGCPLSEKQCLSASLVTVTDDNIKTMIIAVERWSREHPVVTNAQKFEEVFGLPTHCMIDQDAQWWDEPYKEPKHEPMRQ